MIETYAYRLPGIELLDTSAPKNADAEWTSRQRGALQKTLEDFGIPGKITGCITGPRVTLFEIDLFPGVNVKKVARIENNIAINLSVENVRVLAPIPGRSVVGVEVPNPQSETVLIRDVMESEAWLNGKTELPIALGKNTIGEPVVLDLAQAPHMLIASASETDKSVCLDAIITSLLFKFRPDELKFVMIDPKVAEFEEYRVLPHLLAPLINAPNRALTALRWVATEMDRRYGIMAKVHVRKLVEFNSRPPDPGPVFDYDGNEIPPQMPYLVVMINELADLMKTPTKKEIETCIARIAQNGRAAGIHLVITTQRPSTSIINGILEAELPTRLCFQMRAETDSRTVLDSAGAEKLLGEGDMLLMRPLSMTLERVQSAFVSDNGIGRIVEFICGQAKPGFNAAVLTETAEDAGGDEIDELDLEEPYGQDRADIAPLIIRYLRPGDNEEIRKALEVMILDRKASTSYLQRRLKICYNRAAEIIDELEARRVIGPPSGIGNKREILIPDRLDVTD